MRIQTLVLFLISGLLAPQPLAAQDGAGVPDQESRFRLTPHFGSYSFRADDPFDFEDAGFLVGARADWSIGEDVRLVTDIGYTRVSDVCSVPTCDFRYAVDHWLATAGMEYLPIVGDTRLSLGLELGGLRRKDDFPSQPWPGVNDWSSFFVIVPSLAVEHPLTSDLWARISVRDYIEGHELAEGTPVQNYAFTLGLSFAL